MTRVLRNVGIGLGSVVAVVAVAAAALHVMGSGRLANAAPVPVRAVAPGGDAAAIERGRHLAHAVTGCAGCHGADLSGKVLIDEFPIGYIAAPNLTAGAGGFGATATTEDWVRAIAHGVGRDGRVLGGMPSDGFAHLGDDDLGALLAYVTRVPPVDRAWPERRIVFPGTILFGVLGYGDLPYTRIAGGVQADPPPAGLSAEYGRYLLHIATCSDCHGVDYRGRAPQPGPPPGPDLTPAGALGSWSETDFAHLMRTGIRPDGTAVGAEMPFATYAGMTDDELGAIWLALQTMR